jgi:hypothetical protein
MSRTGHTMRTPNAPLSTNPSWPTHRGSETLVRAHVDDAMANRLGQGLYTGDPLADAVVAEMYTDVGETTRRSLRHGIAAGLASLDNPTPAVAALLASTEAMPAYVDGDLLSSGSRPYFSVAPALQQIALTVGSLVNVYSSPAIAEVLSNTGRLVEGTERRVVETGKWLLGAMLPDELRPGRAGYEATFQVRMLHAHIRRSQLRHGHDVGAYGVPNNQADLTRTWLDFTYTPYAAVQRLGIDFTTDEFDQIYRLWWYVGHLLGVEPALYQGIRTQSDAKQLLDCIGLTNQPATERSARLTDAVLRVVAQILRDQTKMPAPLSRSLVNALAWRIHGDTQAHALRVPRSPLTTLLPLAACKIRHDRAKLRKHPDRWNGRIDQILDSARVLLDAPDNPSQFQENLAQ